MHQKLVNFNIQNTFFILDFDQTVTTGGSASSYSLFRRSGILWKDYEEKTQELFSYFHPFEIDHTLPQKVRGKLMYDWHYWAFEVLKEMWLTHEKFEQILNLHHLIHFRKGLKEFLQSSYELWIPVIIFSAGIEQVIVRFLKENNVFFNNIYIQTNAMMFNDTGHFIGINRETFIYPTEKTWDKVSKYTQNKLLWRQKYILLWDMMDDITMAPLESQYDGLKIGFLNRNAFEVKSGYESVFDIVIEDDSTDGGVLEQIINSLKK